MSSPVSTPGQRADLRSLASARLQGQRSDARHPAPTPNALAVLHQLASSPGTAEDALALLHELQVHQVELELQAEEMRNSRAELEARLARRIELYDAAPVGLLTVDRQLTVTESNSTAAELLGVERDASRGRTIDSFLSPRSVTALEAMLTRADQERRAQTGNLQVTAGDGKLRGTHARVDADPNGHGFLIALVETARDEAAGGKH